MANEVAIPARFEVEVRDLEYQRHDGAALLARLYRPIGAGPFPGAHRRAWRGLGVGRPAQQRAARRGAGEKRHRRAGGRFPDAAGVALSRLDRRHQFGDRWLKTHAQEFGSRRELVGGLGTSSGGHQLLLSALEAGRPALCRAAACRGAGEDARCRISCCAGRFRTRWRAIAWSTKKAMRGSSRRTTPIGPRKPRWRRATRS